MNRKTIVSIASSRASSPVEIIAWIAVVGIVAGAMLWGVLGHSKGYPCDAYGRADSHGQNICVRR